MTPASFIPQQVRASEFEIADVLSEIIEAVSKPVRHATDPRRV